MALALAGCGSAEGERVEIGLGEWYIDVSVPEVDEGTITFVVRNEGDLIHEIEVYRKDEFNQEFEAGELENIAPNGQAELSLPLLAGEYELICTIVEKTADGSIFDHYRLGMTTTFTVR